MKLAEIQRTIGRVCTERQPDIADLQRLGETRIWGIYRQMVRRRLHGEIKQVFKRTSDALGATVFEAHFDAALADGPPTTRFYLSRGGDSSGRGDHSGGA